MSNVKESKETTTLSDPLNRIAKVLETKAGITNPNVNALTPMQRIANALLSGNNIELSPYLSDLERIAIALETGKGEGGGGITPTGTIDITENGTTDVTNYATANVNVAMTFPSETKILSIDNKTVDHMETLSESTMDVYFTDGTSDALSYEIDPETGDTFLTSGNSGRNVVIGLSVINAGGYGIGSIKEGIYNEFFTE